MEMLGNRRLGVTQQQAWEALNDPETLKKCIPGCDRFEPSGDNQYSVGLALKIGPVSAKFSGKVALADIQAPDSYKLPFEGQLVAVGRLDVRQRHLAGELGRHRADLECQPDRVFVVAGEFEPVAARDAFLERLGIVERVPGLLLRDAEAAVAEHFHGGFLVVVGRVRP